MRKEVAEKSFWCKAFWEGGHPCLHWAGNWPFSAVFNYQINILNSMWRHRRFGRRIWISFTKTRRAFLSPFSILSLTLLLLHKLHYKPFFWKELKISLVDCFLTSIKELWGLFLVHEMSSSLL